MTTHQLPFCVVQMDEVLGCFHFMLRSECLMFESQMLTWQWALFWKLKFEGGGNLKVFISKYGLENAPDIFDTMSEIKLVKEGNFCGKYLKSNAR